MHSILHLPSQARQKQPILAFPQAWLGGCSYTSRCSHERQPNTRTPFSSASAGACMRLAGHPNTPLLATCIFFTSGGGLSPAPPPHHCLIGTTLANCTAAYPPTTAASGALATSPRAPIVLCRRHLLLATP